MTELNNQQLEIITTNAQAFDVLEQFLSSDLRARFIEFQKRAGDAYAAGQWTIAETREKFVVEKCSQPPTLEETQKIFEEVLTQLQTDKRHTAMQQIQTVQRLLAKTDIESIVGGIQTPMKGKALSQQQRWIIYQNLEWLEPLCDPGVLENKKLEDVFSDFCMRVVKSYNVTPPADQVPTISEAQELFGSIYLALDDKNQQARNMVKRIMNELGFIPSAPAVQSVGQKEKS